MVTVRVVVITLLGKEKSSIIFAFSRSCITSNSNYVTHTLFTRHDSQPTPSILMLTSFLPKASLDVIPIVFPVFLAACV
jgi:hypothetical protein